MKIGKIILLRLYLLLLNPKDVRVKLLLNELTKK